MVSNSKGQAVSLEKARLPEDVIRAIEKSMAEPVVEELPVVQPAQVQPVAQPVATTTDYKPFVYRCQNQRQGQASAVNPLIVVTVFVAISAGLVVGFLGHLLLGATLWASAALFGAAVSSTMVLAATKKNPLFMYVWPLTVSGALFFSFCALHLLPAITVLGWSGYGLVALRALGVPGAIIIFPLILLYGTAAKPNRGIVHCLGWCVKTSVSTACLAIWHLCRFVLWVVGGAVGILIDTAKGVVKREASLSATIMIIHIIKTSTSPSWIRSSVEVGF
jgi:hypothetical protein